VRLSEGPGAGGVTAKLSASTGGPVWQYNNGGSDLAFYIPLRTTRWLDGLPGPECAQIQTNSQLVGFAGDISYDDYLTRQELPRQIATEQIPVPREIRRRPPSRRHPIRGGNRSRTAEHGRAHAAASSSL
jgi:hypothetical protein